MKQKQNQKLIVEVGESIESILRFNPIFLEDNIKVNKVADLLLPYSTGFEIECDRAKNFNEENFIKIPDILDVTCDYSEQRFRIPSGLKGFKCLFNIMETLKTNSIPNQDAGYHYHIDFTDVYDKLTKEFIDSQSSYILKELDKWNYIGTYNRKEVNFNALGGVWVRFQSMFKTMEIRIGEMSFDYVVIINRILHCQEIARNIKINLKLGKNYTKPVNINEIINNRTINI